MKRTERWNGSQARCSADRRISGSAYLVTKCVPSTLIASVCRSSSSDVYSQRVCKNARHDASIVYEYINGGYPHCWEVSAEKLLAGGHIRDVAGRTLVWQDFSYADPAGDGDHTRTERSSVSFNARCLPIPREPPVITTTRPLMSRCW